MKMKHLFALAIVALLAAAPAFAQSFPSAAGNEPPVGSYGQFQISIEPGFASLFAGCPGYNSVNGTFTSPDLYDPGTVIGVSAATTAPRPNPIPVGAPPVSVGHPQGFPLPAPGIHLVRTQIRSLNMVGTGVTVSLAPAPISAGEIDSNSSASDFPAHSYFNVYVQVAIHPSAPCTFSGGAISLYNRNNEPLKVAADLPAGSSLPPSGVVYMHDTTTTVPIRFLTTNGRFWRKDQVIGCITLAGHGIGFKDTPADKAKFQGHMKEHGRPAKGCTGGPIIKPGRVPPVHPEVPKR